MNNYHAHLSGKVNKQNFRYWGTENPSNEIVDESPRSELKVTVWVAIGWYGIGPYFFFDGRTVTVNQDSYCEPGQLLSHDSGVLPYGFTSASSKMGQ